MKAIFFFGSALLILIGCSKITLTTGESVTDIALERFFRQHTIDGNRAAALKKRSIGSTSYLATIHGYPNNLTVCESLIEPYNRDQSLSVVRGAYFCELLE